MNSDDLRHERQKGTPTAAGQGVDDEPGPYQLLEGVVAASRALLEATDFKEGLARWLAHLAESVRANRATYGSLGTHEGGGDGAHVRIGWARSGEVPDSGTVIHETEDCVRWFDMLRDGETVHAQLADLTDLETNRIWKERNCQSILLVPVVVDGRSMGWLGFEWAASREWPRAYQNVLRAAADSAEIAIKRLEAEQRALFEREARLAVESQRAEEAEADAQSVRVREELIRGVTEAAKHLLGPGDFDVVVGAALEALGTALTPTPDRVSLVEDIPTADDLDPGTWKVTYEWYRPDLPAQIAGIFDTGPYPSREWWDRVRVGKSVVLPADFGGTPGPHKVLTTPVPGPTRRWLTIAYGGPINRHWSAAELAVLQTAAACIGAALQQREGAAARIGEEQQRAREASALNELLEGVIAASRALLESADFESGIERWLARLSQALGADRACYRSVPANGDSRGVTRRPINWAKLGRGAVEKSTIPATTDIAAWSQHLERGEAAWIQRAEVMDSATAKRWDKAGVQTSLLLPVFLDGKNEAHLTFEWMRRQEWRAAYGAVLRTAADGAAAAIKRNEATNALVAERERSANERSAELEKANSSMQRTLARLAASQNIDAYLTTALAELHQHAGGVEAYLFTVNDKDNGTMRLRAKVKDKQYLGQDVAADPPAFESGFQPIERSHAQMLSTGRMIWRRIEPTPYSLYRSAEVHAWHLRRGHRGEARYLLQIGDRTVGMIAMAFMNATPLTENQRTVLVALSQPIALALELSRLGEVANRAEREHAVLDERNRMARDVHDTLAQGFTAISLQLQAARLADTTSERDRFVARAALEAKANLADSRRTIRVLRGVDAPADRSGGLAELLEDALSSRLAGSAIKWHVVPLAPGIAEPSLDEDARRELKRIAQEAATNVLKHAHATTFEANILASEHDITVELSDDGRGFDTTIHQDGFGLLGMRERAERIGATLEVVSCPDGPTTIAVKIPLGPQRESRA